MRVPILFVVAVLGDCDALFVKGHSVHQYRSKTHIGWIGENRSQVNTVLATRSKHTLLLATLTKQPTFMSTTLKQQETNQSLIKAASLIILMLQTTALTIFMRVSRLRSNSKALYVSSTAVVMVELLKFLVSILLFKFLEKGELRPVVADVKSFRNWRFSVPAGLYVVQNNLQYIAMNFLPAQIYQIFIQLKIVAAAIVSEKLLDRRHSATQWLSIFGLTAGLAVVQLSLLAHGAGSVAQANSMYIGLSAVLLSCATSGTAGAYTEKLVKGSSQNLWDLNIQMSFFGLLLSLLVVLKDLKSILSNGSFFFGYNPIVWTTILLHALGGIVIAFVVKNTSSVIKSFAQSGAVILSCILSHFLLRDLFLSKQFVIGAMMVCGSGVWFATASQTARTKLQTDSRQEMNREG